MALGSDSPWLALARASTQDRRRVRREQIFETLHREFFPKVFNYVCYRVSNETVAQDITADVFEKALRKLASLRSLDSAGPWLFRIARNDITDYCRRTGSNRQARLEELPEAVLTARRSDSPETQVIQQMGLLRIVDDGTEWAAKWGSGESRWSDDVSESDLAVIMAGSERKG